MWSDTFTPVGSKPNVTSGYITSDSPDGVEKFIRSYEQSVNQQFVVFRSHKPTDEDDALSRKFVMVH
jgi:hypothetical protein